MTTPPAPAPSFLLNWRNADQGIVERGWNEVECYTDANVTGQYDLGPFRFIITFAENSGQSWRPSVVIRARHHPLEQEAPPQYDVTTADHYHGGDMFDELAALCSIVLGCRFRAGPTSRVDLGDDPLGKPVHWSDKTVPQLSRPRRGRSQIPSLAGHVSLGDLSKLQDFLSVSETVANERVKIARLYQDAIWMADTQPEMSWLFLVSAVEVASKIGTTYSRRGPTYRFSAFLDEFKPDPIESELPPFFRFDHSEKNYQESINKIYRYRSRYLHDGTAFPFPMCEPPHYHDFTAEGLGTGFGEVPIGTATWALNAHWKREDVPMLLWTFHHIARGALLNWWTK